MKKETSDWGPAFGIIVIVGVLVLGGVYFFASGQANGVQAPAIGAGNA